MFSASESYEVWLQLKVASSDGEKESFRKILRQYLPKLQKDKDELRMLFYIAMNCERWSHELMLEELENSGGTFTPANLTRIAMYHYAAELAFSRPENDHRIYAIRGLNEALKRQNLSIEGVERPASGEY